MHLSQSVLHTLRGGLAGATFVLAAGCGGASAPPAETPVAQTTATTTPVVAENVPVTPPPPIVNAIEPEPLTHPACGRG